MNNSGPFRLCPKCTTRRSVNEPFCQMLVNEVLCAWDLSEIEIQDEIEETRAGLQFVTVRLTLACPNGHAIHKGDLICPECLADIPDQQSPSEASCAPPEISHPEIVTGWEILSLLPATDDVRQRYSVRRPRDGRHGLLTVYRPGSQPDSQVYEALQNRVPREHIVELIEYGELNGQYYDVTEKIDNGSLTAMSISPTDFGAIREIVEELSTALASFMEVGLRHRTLHPEKILVRSQVPLDLVITGFESGRLSEADLETESLLDISRYTAPEAVMGGVTSASDWWGLGMILLGLLTQNRCFANANDQLFLIHMQASGVSIPEEIDPQLVPLLRGLLTLDRTKRWQWKEVREWLSGGTPLVLDGGGGRAAETQDGPEIALANQRLRDPFRFAIEASRASNWNEACDLLTHGQIGLWADELKLESSIVAGLRQLGRMTAPDAGLRLGLALQLLNRHLPLIYSETIVTPAWLLNHPELGYELITSFLPDLIRQFDIESDDWLLRLSRRASSVRSRAELHEIELDEDRLRVLVLSASHPLLARQWQQRRQELPDASHPVLASLMERDQQTDEDLILLLSASLGQFYSAEELVVRANALSQQLELPVLTDEFAREQLRRPRRELYLEVDDRIKGFARCGHSRLDGMADHFRMEHRLSLPELLLLLASKRESWEKPQNQEYVASVLGFFEKKVSTSNGRGPLVRMTLGKTTPRIDIRELMPDSSSATALLTNLLQRTDKTYSLDSRILLNEEGPERRIRSLLNRTTQYLRDTGINGAYIGFPFVLLRPTGAQTKPRLAPVLLWPVKLSGEIGSRANFSLTFDRDRGSISINPAFDGLYGLDGMAQWKSIANELLSRSSITPAEVVDAFGSMAKPDGRTLARLPKIETARQPEEDQIICSAVLFHLQFTGQSLVEDLRQLKQRPVNGTPLETMLRVRESLTASKSFNSAASAVEGPVDVSDQFLVTESDPSQEEAISRASRLPGLVVQGPPGTGKSQTIVNLVANSIGHQKRVLIVCQKLPALEVVRKRLVAENLGNRLVMLTNITSERRPLLLEIRSQLEGLQLNDSSKPLQREQEARQLESQIRKLEQEIDSHHTSIYEVDPVIGRSYRQILAELIDIEERAPAPVIDVVGLRMMFRNRPASDLIDCEEACSSLAEEWYAAHYEESPLAATQSFAFDQASARELQRLLELFAAAEQEREAIPPPLNPELGHDSPAGLESWLIQHQDHFLQLTDESLNSAAALFSLFQHQGQGDEYTRLLELRLELSSNRGSLSGLSSRFSEWISQFDEQNTKQIAEECARHAALWLSANFEKNSLSVVRLTSPNPEEIQPFRYRLEQLSAAEDDRLKSLTTECLGIHVDSPEPLAQWLAASAHAIQELVNTAGGWIATLLPLEENGGLCGRYARIVREWSELSGAVPDDAASLPQLEQLLGRCSESQLTRVIHDCSVVTHLWVKEPLDSLLLNAIVKFPQNQMECFAVQDAIQHFIASEQKRDALFNATPQPLHANDVEGLRQWLLGAEELLMQASETTYEDAVRWKSLFKLTASGVSLAQEIRQQLVEQIQQIQRIDKTAVDHQPYEKLCEIDDASLDELASLMKRFKATSVGFLGLRRRWAAGPLQRCLRLHHLAVDIKEIEVLDSALQQELKRRHILLELNQLVSRLALTIQSADWPGIIDQARQISQRLVNAFQMCKVISKCPLELLKNAFTHEEFRPSVLKTLDDISKSMEIQDAIATSRHALQALQPFMSSTWLEWQSQNLTKGRLATAHLEYLESLSAALPTLAYSSALRVRLADCDPLIPAILSTLDSMRPSLELRPPDSLAHEISQILRWHALSGRKHELESLAPPLQRFWSVGASDRTQLLNQLATVCALSPYIQSCPVPVEFRNALSSSAAAAVEDFLERCRIGIDQSRARQATWTALASLEQQFDRTWIEECHTAIASNQSNSERLAPVIAALPGLPEYVTFRALVDRLPSRILQAFSLLAEVRESLLKIPEHELARDVSYAIRISHLTQRQSSIEAVNPLLSNLNATSLDGTVRALELLRSSRQLVRRIEQCPLSGPLRSAVVAGSSQRLALVLQDFLGRVSRAKAIDCSLEHLSNLQDWITPQWSINARQIIHTAKSNLANIQELIAAIPNLCAYQIFRARSASLSELHFKVFRLLSGIRSELSSTLTDSDASQLGQIVRHLIRRETLLSWKNQIESRTPSLLVSRQAIAAKVVQLQQLDQKLRELNRQRISSAPLDSIASSNQWEDITRLSGPRARRLREFFHLGRELGLLALRPIWMMTPDVASQLLPLEKSIFDLVIFDEASQMPVEYALPSLYRANSAVVSGDEKQMPPSAFFSNRIESDESEWTDEEELDEFASEQERKIQEQAWNRREVKDCPDLLHLSLASLPQTTLQIHYRSAFRELIGFSNAAFYRNELGVPVRHPDDSVCKHRPIEYIPVGGIYENQQNPEEAKRVVEVLAQIWQESNGHRPSVGIVTFNLKQADLIEELLEERAEQDEEFRKTYAAEQDRKDQGEDMSLFVKNVENVQGDERDCILFSTTFGRTRAGLFRRSFGVLGNAGGERRLNVAVTRARRKVIIVGSMPIDEISDMIRTRRRPETPRDYLQAYLHYATLVSNGQLEESRRLVGRIAPIPKTSATSEIQLDRFRQSVANFVHTLGHELVLTADDPVLGVDFSIRDPHSGEFGMAIECDPPSHRLIQRARAREIWRPSILAGVYPIIHQVSAYAWYHAPQEERDRLRRQLEFAFPKSGERS